MKYIIDLPDNCSWVQWVMTSDKDGHAFFDFKQPRDLTPLDKELSEAYQKGFEAGQHEATTLEYQQGLEEGKKQARAQAHLDVCHDIERVAHGNYQKGLDDAWEMAKRIVLTKTDANCPYFTVEELEKIFGCSTSQSVFDNYSASEAIEKVKAHEQQKADEIKVGDEATIYGINGNVVVVEVDGDCVDLSDLRGWHSWYDSKNVKKTGRHFTQVAELIKAMKEGAE